PRARSGCYGHYGKRSGPCRASTGGRTSTPAGAAFEHASRPSVSGRRGVGGGFAGFSGVQAVDAEGPPRCGRGGTKRREPNVPRPLDPYGPKRKRPGPADRPRTHDPRGEGPALLLLGVGLLDEVRQALGAVRLVRRRHEAALDE